MLLTKEELWKGMSEPIVHTCGDCAHNQRDDECAWCTNGMSDRMLHNVNSQQDHRDRWHNWWTWNGVK